MDRVFTLKIVPLEAPSAGRATADPVRLRFSLEAALLAQVKHPNIVTVYDFGWADARLYIRSDTSLLAIGR